MGPRRGIIREYRETSLVTLFRGKTFRAADLSLSCNRSTSLSPPAGIPEPIQLEADAILRLSFVAEPSEGQIQQAHVQFKDVQDGQVTNLPVVMKGKNRGRFDLVRSSSSSGEGTDGSSISQDCRSLNISCLRAV